MSKTFDVNEWGCPYCDARYEANENDEYIDDVRDESDRKCEECGKRFQLRCILVDLYFEVVEVEQS